MAASLFGVVFILSGIETLHLLGDEACEGPRGRFVLVAVDGNDDGLKVERTSPSTDTCNVDGIIAATSGTALGQAVAMDDDGDITTDGYEWVLKSPLSGSTAGRLLPGMTPFALIAVAFSLLGIAWREADAQEKARA